jgi:hypothetical protein
MALMRPQETRRKPMAETVIDLQASHQQEADGSHTVTVTISGLPTLGLAQSVSDWMRDIIRANAHQIGRLDPKPPRAQ